MPLIKPRERIKKEKINLNLNQKLLQESREYCAWAGIENVDEFLEQAAAFVLEKDLDWRREKKNLFEQEAPHC